MADVIYQYGADVKQVLAALNQIDKTNEKVYKKAERDANRAIKSIISDHQRLLKITNQLDKSIDAEAKAFARAAKEAEKLANAASRGGGGSISGVQLGVVSGAVQALTNQFIQLGQQAVGVLIDIGQQSIQTALEMDTLKARLFGIFDGSQDAADQAFGFIQQKSKELGIDLSELAGAFLPKTESLEQFERVAKIATALARSDPEQGAIGARIALIEALSGTFTSLQRRFEIPKQDIDNIKEAFDTKGMEGFLEELERTLAASGKSFDDLANTAQTSFDKLSISGEQIGGRIGVPIVASLEEAANKILTFLGENEDDIIVFADTIGRTIADAIDLISSIDLGQLDTQSLIAFADYVFRIVNAVQLAIAQFSLLSDSLSPVLDLMSVLNPVFDLGYQAITNLDDALVTLSQILALATASFEAIKVSIETVIMPLESLYDAVSKAAEGDFAGATLQLAEAQKELETALYDTTIPQKAFNDSLLESQTAFDAYQQQVEGNKTAQDELRQTLDETANAGTSAADAILAAGAAERQAAEDADKLAEAQDKVNEALADAATDHARKLEDIDIKAERARLDAQIQFAQKREDAAKNNLEKLADIQRKHQQEITDAATDLDRKEEDISRKFSNERIDLEKEQRQKRVDIETSFRQKLQDIQRQSNLELEDAERSRDAVAFLRIVRERSQQVTEAQTDRQREIEELRTTGQLKKEELAVQQQREIEEAHIANERKIEDLRLSLERQIEAQNIAYGRELEDIRTAEERKFEELTQARERDIEDAKRAYDRKLEDLKIALAEELALIEEFAAAKAAAEASAGEASAVPSPSRPTQTTVEDTDQTYSSRQGGINSQRQRSTYSSSRQGGINTRRQMGFASGGMMRVRGSGGPDSQPVAFKASPGEGVRVYSPQEMSRMRYNEPGRAGNTSNVNNSKSINLSIPADRLTPGQRSEARMIALEVLDETA